MRPDTPCGQVVDYASGTLTDGERTRFELHLAGCEACRKWLETRRLLAHELSCSQQASSSLMARLAADAGTLDPAERRRLEAHLDVCGVCRRELELTRSAIRSAKQPAPLGSIPAGLRRVRLPAPAMVIAASLLLLVVAVVAWLHPGPGEGAPGHSVHGLEILQAERQLTLQDLRVARGARLIARADSVVLSNGFAVDSGGSLTIELVPAEQGRSKQ